MKKPTGPTIAFALLTLVLCLQSAPTMASKNVGGLRLNTPVEYPDGVHFVWTGGTEGTVYGIYRRLQGYQVWERIAWGLTGVSGSADVPGFTLDRTFDYEIRAEQP